MTPQEIRELRSELEINQYELAELVDATQPTVWRWENGKATPPDSKVAIMKQLRERAREKGTSFIDGLLKVAAAGAFIVLLSELFGGKK